GQSETGSIQVEALFANPDNLLRPGQFARVRAVTERLKGALVVPQRAVQEVQGNHQVAVVGDDDTVDIRGVTVGPRYSGLWVILEGVKPGERVVAEGLQKVRTGAKVRPKPYVANAAEEPPASPARGCLRVPPRCPALSTPGRSPGWSSRSSCRWGGSCRCCPCRSRCTPTSRLRRSSWRPRIPAPTRSPASRQCPRRSSSR